MPDHALTSEDCRASACSDGTERFDAKHMHSQGIQYEYTWVEQEQLKTQHIHGDPVHAVSHRLRHRHIWRKREDLCMLYGRVASMRLFGT